MGFATAFVFYFLASYVFKLFTRKYVGIPELTAIFAKKPVKVPNP